MRIIDPLKEPNRWLQVTLLDLLEDDSLESKSALKYAIQVLAMWIEPGIVDHLFAEWIEKYSHLLDEQENNQNSVDPGCSPKGLKA